MPGQRLKSFLSVRPLREWPVAGFVAGVAVGVWALAGPPQLMALLPPWFTLWGAAISSALVCDLLAVGVMVVYGLRLAPVWRYVVAGLALVCIGFVGLAAWYALWYVPWVSATAQEFQVPVSALVTDSGAISSRALLWLGVYTVTQLTVIVATVVAVARSSHSRVAPAPE